jgi:hypothetical protein
MLIGSVAFLLLLAVFIWHARHLLYTARLLATLPIRWDGYDRANGSSRPSFYVDSDRDAFDLTFQAYNVSQLDSGEGQVNRVPSVLHHIALGEQTLADLPQEWSDARQSCLNLHPGWDVHLWTDETARRLVDDKFPHLKDLWDGYPYPIQRVDALRYMILRGIGHGSRMQTCPWTTPTIWLSCPFGTPDRI